jgi:hypothetical protein
VSGEHLLHMKDLTVLSIIKYSKSLKEKEKDKKKKKRKKDKFF